MIFERVEDMAWFSRLDDAMAAAVAWIASVDPLLAKIGRHEVGNGIYALVQEYVTKERAETVCESHRIYLDLQYMVRGSEIVEVQPLEGLQAVQPYEQAKDAALYEDKPGWRLRLSAGMAAVFFPHDAHRPCLADGETMPVRKIVVKIPVPERLRY